MLKKPGSLFLNYAQSYVQFSIHLVNKCLLGTLFEPSTVPATGITRQTGPMKFYPNNCNFSVYLDSKCLHTHSLLSTSLPYLIKSYSCAAWAEKPLPLPWDFPDPQPWLGPQDLCFHCTCLVLPLREHLIAWHLNHAGSIACEALRTRTPLLWSLPSKSRHSNTLWINGE